VQDQREVVKRSLIGHESTGTRHERMRVLEQWFGVRPALPATARRTVQVGPQPSQRHARTKGTACSVVGNSSGISR
jgi:hypothetical protein